MRTEIREYIELTDSEKTKLWDKATFVFDTNVYLNLYRYSEKTRNALITAMEQLTDRIWMPNHVAHEYAKRRLEIIYESANQYKSLHNESKKFFDTFTKTLRFKDEDSEYTELQTLIKKIDDWLENIKKKNLLVKDGTDDHILDMLLNLYDGKVGTAFSEDELKAIIAEGGERYSKKVPPGYKDASKAGCINDNNAYGDLIIWKEILKYATAKHKDIIYVTHDQKEDWWNIVHGETVGPRIELRKEFIDSTGQTFHMYNMASFIERVKNRGGKDIDQSVINEVNHVYSIPFDPIDDEFFHYDLHYFNKNQVLSDYMSRLKMSISNLETKNRRRRKDINSLKAKYAGQDMPKGIIEQIMNTEKNCKKTSKQIAKLEQEFNTLVSKKNELPVLDDTWVEL